MTKFTSAWIDVYVIVLAIVVMILAGCTTTFKPDANYPNESETQQKLRNDPRWQKLMDKLAAPKDDKVHVSCFAYGVKVNGTL